MRGEEHLQSDDEHEYTQETTQISCIPVSRLVALASVHSLHVYPAERGEVHVVSTHKR